MAGNTMSVNTLQYVIESRWEENTELDKVLKNFYFKNILKIPKLKTNDLMVLYALKLSSEGKKAFNSTYLSWKNKKDAETCKMLVKLFFISELASNEALKKDKIYFVKNTEIEDVDLDLKCVLFFLKQKYSDKKLKMDCDSDTILSLMSSMMQAYENRDMMHFYKLQTIISAKIKTEKLDIFEKISVCLFSRMDEFQGIQLDRKDSLDFLKSHSKESFYDYIKKYFKEAFFKYWGWYSINIVLLLLALSKYLSWIRIDEMQWNIVHTSGIPQYIAGISASVLWILFLLSVIIVIIVRTAYFFARLRKI